MSDTSDMFRRFQRHPEALEQADTVEKFVELVYAGPAKGHADAGVIEHFIRGQHAWTRYVFRTLKAHGIDTAPSRPLYVPEAKTLTDIVWDVRFLPCPEGGQTREQNLQQVGHRLFLSGLRSKGDIPFGTMGGTRSWSPGWLKRGEKIRQHNGGKTYGCYARPQTAVLEAWRSIVGGVIDALEFVRWDDGRTLVLARGEKTFELWLALLDPGACGAATLMPFEDQQLIADNKAAAIAAWGDDT